MSIPLLTTKLYIPSPRPNLVPRPKLINCISEGISQKLVLICAPAGFGKTTLLSDWVCRTDLPVAWLSLDTGDNELKRFLIYMVAALQTIDDQLCHTVKAMLQSPQPVSFEAVLTEIINEVASLSQNLVLILEDYHFVEDQTIHEALTFLVEKLPPVMHLVISSRSDPFLPLSRLRARGDLIELRTEDLRFSIKEATVFLNRVMGLSLSENDILSLERRTEGWITGLQLAAISLRGKQDSSELIKSFSGSHRLVLDYLIDEVLEQQGASVQSFLMQTAVLERFNGSLCDALTGQDDGQETLEYLDHANLFIIPLDNERHWYRYHHLFADLLRQRLRQKASSTTRDELWDVTKLHKRASTWFEEHSLEIEAFQHAVAANDLERAERLIEGKGVPLQYRGAAGLVQKWLDTLPDEILNTRPSLLVTYASALNLTGDPTGAEATLSTAEAALESNIGPAEPDERTINFFGHIAAIRAMMASGQHDLDTLIVQSNRALELVHKDNVLVRTITAWTLGYAYQLQGDLAAASQAYQEVLTNSQASGDIVSTLAAATGLGNIFESENQLYKAAESYQHGMLLFRGQPIAVGTYLGMARIHYEWNNLEAAEEYGQESLSLARQLKNLDTFTLCGVLLARLRLAQGNIAEATKYISLADQFMRQHDFMHRLPEVADVQVLILLAQGDLDEAADLADKHELHFNQARINLARGETSAALAVLEPLRQEVEAKGWEEERLKVMVLQAVALFEHGKLEQAVSLLGDALALAEPGGIIRTFADEGLAMRRLLQETQSRIRDQNIQVSPGYMRQLLGAFSTEVPERTEQPKYGFVKTDLLEPLTNREMHVLRLLNTELSGPEIAQALSIALSTFRSHTKSIYNKLDVNSRRAAVLKAEDLNLI
jgi:LuxR family maltose regulon positive regulatory protein